MKLVQLLVLNDPTFFCNIFILKLFWGALPLSFSLGKVIQNSINSRFFCKATFLENISFREKSFENLWKGISTYLLREYVVKLVFYKKATKIEKNLCRRFDTYYIMSNRRWRFRQFLRPFSKTWSLHKYSTDFWDICY